MTKNDNTDDAGCILIIAGGTGGHIYPGLAVARYLKLEGFEVKWLGTPYGNEAKIVPLEFPYITTRSQALRAKGLKRKMILPFSLLLYIYDAFKTLKKLSPRMVISFGGYVSAPGSIACKLLGKKLLIHEQNARAGMTNQWLARLADKVLGGLENADANHNFQKVVGNPVRQAVAKLYDQQKHFQRFKLNVLILGGSLGAETLNQVIPKLDNWLYDENLPCLWHQCGDHYHKTVTRYETTRFHVTVTSFIEDIAQAYAWADLVISRAGASTVSEITHCGLPAIFVPYPYAVDDHQYYNARMLVEKGAAYCLRNHELTPEKLALLLSELNNHRAKLKTMSQLTKSLAHRDATGEIVRSVHQMLN